MTAMDQLWLVKQAERQYVSPAMAALSSVAPFGAITHGTVAGHSPREGMREELGHTVGGSIGGVGGGLLGAYMGSHSAGKQVHAGLKETLSRRMLRSADPSQSVVPISNASKNRLSRLLIKSVTRGGVRGATYGMLTGAVGLGAAGAAYAAHGGNEVVRRNRILSNPILVKMQDYFDSHPK